MPVHLLFNYFLSKFLLCCCRNGAIRLENTCIDLDGQAEFETKKLTVGLISLKGMYEKPTKQNPLTSQHLLMKKVIEATKISSIPIKSYCLNVQPFGRLETIIGSKIKRCLKDSIPF